MNFLDEIIKIKKAELSKSRQRGLAKRRNHPQTSFIERVKADKSRVHIIAEIKKASPSKGDINTAIDPAKYAGIYEAGGASAVSVLTESVYFKGSLADLEAVKKTVKIPVLRKDFIIDPFQVEESYYAGADLILLIADMLDKNQLKELYSAAREHALDVLVEFHSLGEIDKVMSLSPRLVGVNSRDLKDMTIDLTITEEAFNLLSGDVIKVAESGIKTTADLVRMKKAGANAVLIGEALMSGDKPAAFLRELAEAARQ